MHKSLYLAFEWRIVAFVIDLGVNSTVTHKFGTAFGVVAVGTILKVILNAAWLHWRVRK